MATYVQPSLFLSLLLLVSVAARPGLAQDAADSPTGFKFAGIPVVNFSSDEGVGYGARASLFNHADGTYNPYLYTLETQLFFTTKGRRQVVLFFDAPHLPGRRQRLTAEFRYQRFDPAPYYGLGNDSDYDEALTDTLSPTFRHEDYYGFQRTRTSLWASYQRPLGPIKLLAGLGVVHSDITLYDGPTLLLTEPDLLGRDGGFTNYVKVGLLYDTRDFEPAPGRGDWTDLILEMSHNVWGSDYDYARLTFTNRHYITLAKNLVFAERIIFEKSWGDIPFYETTFTGSSFKIEEGLGGSKSIRGQRLNRFAGPTKLFGNLEVRWRITSFTLLQQDLFIALSGFVDYGRVWRGDEGFTLSNLHLGQGVGFHGGWNETFIVTANFARSDEVNMAFYLSFGYLY